jgi:hypothetical protein
VPKKPFDITLDLKTTTIAKAQEQMQLRVRGAGVICPCCRQVVRILEKELSPTMAYVLILIHRHFESTTETSGWLHVSKYLENMSTVGAEVKGGEWSKLKHWQLIEEHPPVKKSVLSNKPTPKVEGLYRLTERGTKFVKGETKVPNAIHLYEGHLMGFGPKDVGIKDCLGKDYSYEDLMAGKLAGFVV